MQPSSAQSRVLERFSGITLRVPDLCPLFASWSSGASPFYEELQAAINRWLPTFIKDSKLLRKAIKADFALFASHWWPTASFENLRVAAFFITWMFLWDDEVDQQSGSLADDFSKAQVYREETIEFVRHSLGLGTEKNPSLTQDVIIRGFAQVGRELSQRCPIESRTLIFNEFESSVHAAAEEQVVRLKDDIPSIDEYWAVRLSASAVGMSNAILELTQGVKIPHEAFQDPDFNIIWNMTKVIACITNDIYSLRKEIAKEGIYSLIPLATESMTPEQSLHSANRTLEISIAHFDAAVERLLLRSPIPERFALERFIEGLRLNCTGNCHWSLVTDRYGLKSYRVGPGNELEIRF